MANSKRRCKHCREYVSEWLAVPAGVFCNLDHAIAWQENARQAAAQKAYKAKTADRKRKILDNDRSHWLKQAQTAFNAFIRARDSDQPCISCGRHHDGQYHAGHYRSVGSCPELRFDERNVFKQCMPCNAHLSGNLINYRVNLILKIGPEAVESLEGPHDPKKYTVDDLKQIASAYKRKLKELQNG